MLRDIILSGNVRTILMLTLYLYTPYIFGQNCTNLAENMITVFMLTSESKQILYFRREWYIIPVTEIILRWTIVNRTKYCW